MKSLQIGFIGVVACLSVSGQSLDCNKTLVPDLFIEWKKQVLNQNATEEDVKAFAEKARLGLPSFDPFTPIAYDTIERKRKKEVVVWEDDSIMVALDSRNKRKFLVVPKATKNFIVDASPVLRVNLAKVAAVTSDAIRWAFSAPCTSYASIYIHPPGGLGVRQLHIHVEPRYNFKKIDLSEFNSRVEQYLKNNLLVRY